MFVPVLIWFDFSNIKVNNVMQAKVSHQVVKIWNTVIAHTLYLVGHWETSISVLISLYFVC